MRKLALRNESEFVRNLTNAPDLDIQRYFTEVSSDREFHECMGQKKSSADRRRSSYWGVSPSLGEVLYSLCRIVKPEAVVETGVASGVSTSYLLCALEKNEFGILHSIDLSWQGQQIGWVIPDYLRHRWHFYSGSSSDRLLPLLEQLGMIDIFLHDSDHSYENMRWEFDTAWSHLKAGGVLISHNIDYNDAFRDFCRDNNVEGRMLDDMGGIVALGQF